MAIDKQSYTRTKHTGIKIHKDGLRYWFDFKIAGKRYSRLWKSNENHTKADRLKSAYNELEKIKQEISHASTITADMDATVDNYFENLKATKSKWSAATLKKYELYYDKHIKSSMGKLKIKDVKPSHFTSFNKTIAYLAPASRKRAYEILQPLFKLAIEDEIIVRSPIKTAHIPVRNQMSEKKVVTDAVTKYKIIYTTINRLFNTEDLIEKKKIQCSINPHHRAIFLFGFYGRRLNEVLSLEWDDIDFVNNQYRVKKEVSKINQDMVFSLPKDIREALLEFRSNGKIFNINEVRHYYQSIRDISGIEEFTFHWMRNLSVSALASMGVDVTHLSAMLGHQDASTLKKYLSLQREASTAVTNEMSMKLLES